MGTYRDTDKDTHGYTWTHRVLDTEINILKGTQRAVRTEWDNDIKCQVRGFMGRTPTVCCFSKTKQEGKSINNTMNYILNKIMSSGPEGTNPGHSQLNNPF